MTAIEKMRAHIDQLAAQHRITVTFDAQMDPEQGVSNHDRRDINVPPITAVKGYTTALHEIGHIVQRDLGVTTYDGPGLLALQLMDVDIVEDYTATIQVEQEAWAWAREAAILWTPEMEADAQHSLGTYFHGRDIAKALPSPLGLLRMSVLGIPEAQTWARKRMRDTLRQVNPTIAEKAIAQLESEWARRDKQETR